MMVYHVDDLRKAYERGEKFKFIFFWGNTATKPGIIDQSCLSQWWGSNFMVEGVNYSCAEQFMMAEKARLFGDDTMLEAICAANHPKQMKALGRMVANFETTRWDEAAYGIVKAGNMAKFSQNPNLLAYLLGTKNRILVEASPRDRIWGIGMGKANPDAQNPSQWQGKNLLGFALMEVRDLLIEKRV